MNDESSYFDGLICLYYSKMPCASFLSEMADQKSKYLVWLETLHREYTERTSITLFGQQAMLIKLLADIFEVRCRFEKILKQLESKAIPLEDNDVNYKEWYNPGKWKIIDSSLCDEEIRETFGISQDSPLDQTYANHMLTPFGKNANFSAERYRNVVSSLFVLNTIVDEQKMEVAINDELEKLQKILLDISNVKSRQKEPEEYAAYFKTLRINYKKSFLIKGKLQAEHRSWKDNNYDDDYREALKERRVGLLLDLFDSGFLDDLKGKSHRKTEDILGFKDYDFEKWNDRIDDAIRYFAALCKICPFKDDMIVFNDYAKIGRYIIDEHIEAPMVEAFLRVMELIIMVQKEMRTLDDPNYVEGNEKTPAEIFIEKVKRLFLLMEDENGTIKQITRRGNGGSYTFEVRGKALCEVMDDILINHEDSINAYLDGATKETAIQLKYVCPFIGYILDTNLYSTPQLQNKDLTSVFEKEYTETSAVSKMKHKDISDKAQNFFEFVKETMEKHLKASKTSMLE